MVPFSSFFKYCSFREKVILYLGYVFAALAGLIVPSTGILMGQIAASFDPNAENLDVAKTVQKVLIYI